MRCAFGVQQRSSKRYAILMPLTFRTQITRDAHERRIRRHDLRTIVLRRHAMRYSGATSAWLRDELRANKKSPRVFTNGDFCASELRAARSNAEA
jgi:hypothetical protein